MMINYNGKLTELKVEGKPEDILVELIAIMKYVQFKFKKEGKEALFRNYITLSLYDDKLDQELKDLIKVGEKDDQN